MEIRVRYDVMKFNKNGELKNIENDNTLIFEDRDYTLADYISDHINLDSIAEIDVKNDNDVMIELLDGTFEEYVVTSIEDIEE